MDADIGKIGQATSMVEVRVSQDDMVDIFRWIAQPRHLADGGFLGIQRDDGDRLEYAYDRWRVEVIVLTKAGVDQGRSLIGLEQQTQCAALPALREAGIAGETVQKVD